MLLQASAKGLSSSPWSVRRCATVLGTRAAYAMTNWEDGQAAHDHPAEAFEATLINAIFCQPGHSTARDRADLDQTELTARSGPFHLNSYGVFRPENSFYDFFVYTQLDGRSE